MDEYFTVLKDQMQKRVRIPEQLIEKYKDEICFMVDTNHTYSNPAIPRIAWIQPLEYEINIDQASKEIDALLNEPLDKKQPKFGTYEEAKKRIKFGLVVKKIVKKKDKMVKNLKKILLAIEEEISQEEEVEKEE